MEMLPYLNFKLKSVYLIIHVTQNKALQVPLIDPQAGQFDPQFTAINEKNAKQLWIIDQRQPGFVELVNGLTNKILTAQESGKISLKKGKDQKKQQWILAENNGLVRIQNAQFSQLYLSFDAIQKKPVLKKNTNDFWQFRKVTKNDDLSKTCFIYEPKSQKMIDVPQSSFKQQQKICVWNPNYRFNQRWRLYKAGEVYIIKSYLSNLNMDVYEQNFVEDQKIVQYHSTGGSNQLWMLERMDNQIDQYRIYCFAQPEFQLGHDGKKLVLYKGKKFIWKIEGYIPE